MKSLILIFIIIIIITQVILVREREIKHLNKKQQQQLNDSKSYFETYKKSSTKSSLVSLCEISLLLII